MLNEKQIMTNWMADHSRLIEYFEMGEVISDNLEIPEQFVAKRKTVHQEMVKIISDIYDKQANQQKSKISKIFRTIKHSVLPTLQNYKLLFAKYKIAKIREKQFKKFSADIAEILNFFEKDMIQKNIIIRFDIKSFEKDTFVPTFQMKALMNFKNRLKKYELQLVQENSVKVETNNDDLNDYLMIGLNYNYPVFFQDFNSGKYNNMNSSFTICQKKLKDKITRIIDGIISIYDESISYFPITQLDSEFEELFYSPFFPFKNEYTCAFNKIKSNLRYIFLQSANVENPEDIKHEANNISVLLDLSYKIIRFYELEEIPTDSILFLLIFRCLFNDLYITSSIPFLNENFDPKINISSKNQIEHVDEKRSNTVLSDFVHSLTFQTLQPPETSCLVNEFLDNMNVFDTISKDPRFEKAVHELFAIQFTNNPIDALNCVRLCINSLEISSSIFFNAKEIEGMIPFEDIFGLFLLTIAGCEFQEIDQYSRFATYCVQKRLLSLPFQFALTKLSAASTHLLSLMNNTT